MNGKTPKATSFHHALQKILSCRIQKVKFFSWSPNLTNQKFLTSILCKCCHKKHVLHVSLFVQKKKKKLEKSEEEEAAATKHLSFSIHLFTPSLHEEEERLPYIFFHYGLDFF